MRSSPAGGMDDRRRHFEEIYAANRGPVLAYLLRRTASAEDAADVLAETFLTAWRRLDDLPAGERTRLWLYGVARNVLANHQRGERRRSALTDRLHAELSTAYQPPQYTGAAARIAAALRSLPEADREVLTLASWEELDAGEIAEVLGCSRNAVRIRLHRARRRLADAYQAQPSRQDCQQPNLAQLMSGEHP